jgi:2-methylisocitrate lyase-like PEP mutase family enzyme
MGLPWQLYFITSAFTPIKALVNLSKAEILRNLYQTRTSDNGPAIILPGVHDALSAKVFAHSGAKALFLSGFGVSASKLGLPDLGLLTLSEMQDTLTSVVQAAGNVPVIVDGDTGYGGLINVRRTVRSFAAAGAAAITIEDQVFPKICTYAAGKGVRVVSRDECVDRIQAALKARDEAKHVDGHDILIVGRTDCRGALGYDEALWRCKMFEDAGCDICYAENLQSRYEYEHLRSVLLPSTPSILAQVQTGSTDQQLYTMQDIGEMNYDFALFGITALQGYMASLTSIASQMMASDGTGFIEENKVMKLTSFDDVKRFMGFDDYETIQNN